MQINSELLQKLKVAAVKNAGSYVEKVLVSSTEHGNFGMDLVDRLHDQLPATACDNCGACCNSISIFSIEYHRIIRDLMTRCPPERLRRFIVSALRLDQRQAEIGSEKRLRCVFRDDETKVCLIHPVRPFACRIFGLLKSDGTRECERVRDINFPPQTVSEEFLTELQSRVLENSESYEPFEGTGKIHFFPVEFWIYRYLFSPQRALQIYREVMIPMSGALTSFWKDKRKFADIETID